MLREVLESTSRTLASKVCGTNGLARNARPRAITRSTTSGPSGYPAMKRHTVSGCIRANWSATVGPLCPGMTTSHKSKLMVPRWSEPDPERFLGRGCPQNVESALLQNARNNAQHDRFIIDDENRFTLYPESYLYPSGIRARNKA